MAKTYTKPLKRIEPFWGDGSESIDDTVDAPYASMALEEFKSGQDMTIRNQGYAGQEMVVPFHSVDLVLESPNMLDTVVINDANCGENEPTVRKRLTIQRTNPINIDTDFSDPEFTDYETTFNVLKELFPFEGNRKYKPTDFKPLDLWVAERDATLQWEYDTVSVSEDVIVISNFINMDFFTFQNNAIYYGYM